MTVKFTGGIMDGHSEDVPGDAGWAEVNVLAISNQDMKVVEIYERLGETGSTHYFTVVDKRYLNPGESIRIVRLPAKFYE